MKKPYKSLESSSGSAACNLITQTSVWTETEGGMWGSALRVQIIQNGRKKKVLSILNCNATVSMHQ